MPHTGNFLATSDDTFILTADDKLTLERLDQLLDPLRFRDEPIELLTLSACQTAAGDERAALGLAGVAVRAGARSALATLWYINDQASSELVAAFYRHLRAAWGIARHGLAKGADTLAGWSHLPASFLLGTVSLDQ